MALATLPPPPPTAVHPVTEVIHGVKVTDPYRWLEDQNSPAVRTWIDAQMKYTRSVLDPLPGRDAFRKRLTELLRTESITVPEARGGAYFYMKRGADENRYSIWIRRGGKDDRLIDAAAISKDENTSITLMAVSDDGKLLAYGVQQGGADESRVHLFDVDARKDTADEFPTARYESVEIAPDRSGIYYALLPNDGPRLYSRPLGKPGAAPEFIFGEGFGPELVIGCELSEDGRWLTILAGRGWAETEIYLMDLTRGRKVVPIFKVPGNRAMARVAGGQMYLSTTWDAPNGRIFRIDPERPQQHFWKLIVPEAPQNLENFTLAGGRILAEYLNNATTRIRVFDAGGAFLRDVHLPGLGLAYTGGQWSSPEAFIGYQSFATPPVILRYDAADGRQSEWARTNTPIDPARFEVEQVWFRSKDSTRVPMFLLSRKDIPMDGKRPTILTGYGGFAASMTPFFAAEYSAWVEQGGVVAIPNLRGGAEFGEQWHLAGMKEKKQNVFDDFIAASEWLIKNGVTDSRHLSIDGTSNGGLLVGAAMTQRPDLYRAVVCGKPLLDMIRYQLFLIARVWVPEYGSSEDPKQFEYLLKYSPYQNVKDGTKYPAVLFVSGDADTRVAPLHARKMAARLQAASTSGLPILLLYDTSTGHAGVMPVYKQIEDGADILSFLTWQISSSEAPPK